MRNALAVSIALS